MIFVFDDVLLDPIAYRARALKAPFRDVVAPGNVVFHGMTHYPADVLMAWLTPQFPMLSASLSLLRQSPDGQEEPNFIHTDLDMGQWTGILYLTPQPAAGDGTTFWRDKADQCPHSRAGTLEALQAEYLTWRDREQWEPWATVDARFNRLVLFPAHLFHSRSLFDNYGTMGEDARLIQILFGQGILPDVERMEVCPSAPAQP